MTHCWTRLCCKSIPTDEEWMQCLHMQYLGAGFPSSSLEKHGSYVGSCIPFRSNVRRIWSLPWFYKADVQFRILEIAAGFIVSCMPSFALFYNKRKHHSRNTLSLLLDGCAKNVRAFATSFSRHRSQDTGHDSMAMSLEGNYDRLIHGLQDTAC